MPLHIFVEDQAVSAYEFLALRALGQPALRDHRIVRAFTVDPEELTSVESLLDLTRLAGKSGTDLVLFLMDQEGPRSRERPAQLERFRSAFKELCDHLQSLRPEEPLHRVKVARIICQCCLEGWLAADPQAIVDAVRGKRGLDYHPPVQRTDDLVPEKAIDRIGRVIRQAGIELKRRDLQKITSSGVKSLGPQIAKRISPDIARRYNRSLEYFYEILQKRRNGCDYPFPDGPIEP